MSLGSVLFIVCLCLDAFCFIFKHTQLFRLELLLNFIPCILSERWVKQEIEISKSSQAVDTGPKLDLGFKEGQTITLNIGVNQSSLQFVTDNK